MNQSLKPQLYYTSTMQIFNLVNMQPNGQIQNLQQDFSRTLAESIVVCPFVARQE